MSVAPFSFQILLICFLLLIVFLGYILILLTLFPTLCIVLTQNTMPLSIQSTTSVTDLSIVQQKSLSLALSLLVSFNSDGDHDPQYLTGPTIQTVGIGAGQSFSSGFHLVS